MAQRKEVRRGRGSQGRRIWPASTISGWRRGLKQMPWRSLSMEKTDRGKRGKVGRRRKEEEQGRSGDGVGLQVAEGWPGWPGTARSPAAALGGGGTLGLQGDGEEAVGRRGRGQGDQAAPLLCVGCCELGAWWIEAEGLEHERWSHRGETLLRAGWVDRGEEAGCEGIWAGGWLQRSGWVEVDREGSRGRCGREWRRRLGGSLEIRDLVSV